MKPDLFIIAEAILNTAFTKMHIRVLWICARDFNFCAVILKNNFHEN